MPGQRKLSVTTSKGPEDLYEKFYTCDWYEFQGAFLVMHGVYESGEGLTKAVAVGNVVRVEEH